VVTCPEQCSLQKVSPIRNARPSMDKTEAGAILPPLIPRILRQGLKVALIRVACSVRMRPLPLVPDACCHILLPCLQVAALLGRHECMDVETQRQQLFLSLSQCQNRHGTSAK